MSLVSVFRQYAAPETWSHFADQPEFETVLENCFLTGQAAWPELGVPGAAFIAFLARHLPSGIVNSREFATLHVEDLYLVCAYGLGNRQAAIAIEQRYMPKAQRALRRVNTTDASSADIIQKLRLILIEMHDESVTRRGYSGRSELASWLCLCALRDTALCQKREQREKSMENASLELVPADGYDPETCALIHRYKDEFEAAFREALQAMNTHERNLLRFHFLNQLNIDQIASFYKIHRATAARRVSAARERLVAETRRRFRERVLVNTESMPRILELIHGQAGVSIGHLMVQNPDPEAASG